LALEEVETLHCGEAAAIRDCDEVAEVTRLARVEGSLGCGGLETWTENFDAICTTISNLTSLERENLLNICLENPSGSPCYPD